MEGSQIITLSSSEMQFMFFSFPFTFQSCTNLKFFSLVQCLFLYLNLFPFLDSINVWTNRHYIPSHTVLWKWIFLSLVVQDYEGDTGSSGVEDLVCDFSLSRIFLFILIAHSLHTRLCYVEKVNNQCCMHNALLGWNNIRLLWWMLLFQIQIKLLHHFLLC